MCKAADVGVTGSRPSLSPSDVDRSRDPPGAQPHTSQSVSSVYGPTTILSPDLLSPVCRTTPSDPTRLSPGGPFPRFTGKDKWDVDERRGPLPLTSQGVCPTFSRKVSDVDKIPRDSSTPGVGSPRVGNLNTTGTRRRHPSDPYRGFTRCQCHFVCRTRRTVCVGVVEMDRSSSLPLLRKISTPVVPDFHVEPPVPPPTQTWYSCGPNVFTGVVVEVVRGRKVTKVEGSPSSPGVPTHLETLRPPVPLPSKVQTCFPPGSRVGT